MCHLWDTNSSMCALHVCAPCICPLASPFPGLHGMSGRWKALWDAHFGEEDMEEGASPTCCILFPRLSAFCSCVWHTTSSPSAPTRSCSAFWWACSATSWLSSPSPWCSGKKQSHYSLCDRWWSGAERSSPSLMMCCCDGEEAGHAFCHVRQEAITQVGCGEDKDGRQTRLRHTDRLYSHTHMPVYRDYMLIKSLSSTGRGIMKQPQKERYKLSGWASTLFF